ncbi:MAG: histidine phosphatase family protein [Christensenellaceae bacterium]|jgi:broad specificity phosphatase PhoE|nr:histidine phosphatase family protein [Christensenellaceae bacterium]
MDEVNIFEDPQFYREKLLQCENLIVPNYDKISGRSLICVFFTSYCGVGCPFCFFKSPSPENKDGDIQNRLNYEAIDKFIKFANDANVGYLQISGGGEPFLERGAILKSIENIEADRIILVTSGSWALDKKNAEEYLEEIQKSIEKRKSKSRISIRLSVSRDHSITLGERPLINLLKIFEEKYKNDKVFTLQLKTFTGDNTLYNYLEKYFGGYKIETIGKNQSDDDNVVKIIPWKYKIMLPSGYEVILGKARFFEPSLMPNLYDRKSIYNTINVYNDDLDQSQSNFPALVFNLNGKCGLDWIVEYNGNVCTWQNRVQDNLLNIYEDNYDTILDNTTKDLITLSFIEKGSKYRESIISEISPKTVTLTKAVSIRDYAGTLLFEDEKIRLYYNLRVLQDYIKENRINKQALFKLPKEFINTLCLDKTKLRQQYNRSSHSVFRQELRKEQSDVRFNDFLNLVNRGHYELNKNNIMDIREYAKLVKGIGHEPESNLQRRLTKRVMLMKKLDRFTNAQKDKKKIIYLIRHGETDFNIAKIIKGQSKSIKTVFSERGLKQILTLSKFLKKNNIERIYGSDMKRVMETVISADKKLNVPFSFHKELRGLNMGMYQEIKIPIAEFLKQPEIQLALTDHSVCIKGGESINNLIERFMKFINYIICATPYKNVAIITHGAAISNVYSKIAAKPYQDISYCKLEYLNDNLKAVGHGIQLEEITQK